MKYSVDKLLLRGGGCFLKTKCSGIHTDYNWIIYLLFATGLFAVDYNQEYKNLKINKFKDKDYD